MPISPDAFYSNASSQPHTDNPDNSSKILDPIGREESPHHTTLEIGAVVRHHATSGDQYLNPLMTHHSYTHSLLQPYDSKEARNKKQPYDHKKSCHPNPAIFPSTFFPFLLPLNRIRQLTTALTLLLRPLNSNGLWRTAAAPLIPLQADNGNP